VPWKRTADYLEFWAGIIGKVPATVAKRMRWNLESCALRGGKQQCSLLSIAGLQPASRSIGLATPMSREEALRQCSLHHKILMYDHVQRPLARDIHCLCVDLSEHAASESGSWLAASSIS